MVAEVQQLRRLALIVLGRVQGRVNRSGFIFAHLLPEVERQGGGHGNLDRGPVADINRGSGARPTGRRTIRGIEGVEYDLANHRIRLRSINTAFDHILQFANITGPSVLAKGMTGFLGKPGEQVASELRGHIDGEMLGQKRDVAGAFPQRW